MPNTMLNSNEDLIALLDDPICALLMNSDHIGREDILGFLSGIVPVYNHAVEVKKIVPSDRRQCLRDRRRPPGSQPAVTIDFERRGSLIDRRALKSAQPGADYRSLAAAQ